MKIIRDPIHGEIKIFPIEWLIIDTPLFQRLRFVSQLVGSHFVFPGCTHNRFSHSLGSMNIASMYAQKFLNEDKIDYLEYRILRLSSLLHDISHGPFSHQFDETVYKKYNYTNGHDEFKIVVIKKFLPYFIEKKINEKRKNQRLEEGLEQEIKDLKFQNKNILEAIIEMLDEVIKVFQDKDSYRFGIVQGTLGADRLDFIWRDSYFSGIKGFSKGDIERIISNSYIIENKLVYHVKAFDEIFSALFGRFMLYKNLYFHKTARAADLMVQKILNLYSEIIDFREYLEDPEKFVLLTDDFILNLHYHIPKENKNKEKIKEIEKLIERIKNRNLWKMVSQEYMYEENFEKEEDTGELIVDITEELNIYEEKGNIFLFDGKEIINFSSFIKNNPIYNINQPKIRIKRIYQP